MGHEPYFKTPRGMTVYYASQVPGLAAQNDHHVHPAEPRTFRLTLRYAQTYPCVASSHQEE